MVAACSRMVEAGGQITHPAQTKFDSHHTQPPATPQTSTHKSILKTWGRMKIGSLPVQITWHMKSPWRQQLVLPLTLFDLTTHQHVTFSTSKYMQLWTKEAMNYDTNASKIMKGWEVFGRDHRLLGTGYTCHWRRHLCSRCLIHPPYSPSKPWGCIRHTPHSVTYCSHTPSP